MIRRSDSGVRGVPGVVRVPVTVTICAEVVVPSGTSEEEIQASVAGAITLSVALHAAVKSVKIGCGVLVAGA